MNKKLTTKVQKITPKISTPDNGLSSALDIVPDNEIDLEKKGVIYTVFDILGKENIDKALVEKIVDDVLHDAYFQSASASPIQATEKAVLKLRDNIIKLSKNPQESESGMHFNISSAVLWGNTLYLVQYGDTHVYLMRKGKIKPIDAATEGKFSVAAGIVKDNDVVILATSEFIKRYPPEQLIQSADISVDQLKSLESCLIIKFVVEKEFTTDETIDFGSHNQEIQAQTPTKEVNIPKTTEAKFVVPKPKLKLKLPSINYGFILKIALDIKKSFLDLFKSNEHTKGIKLIIILFSLAAVLAVATALIRTKNKDKLTVVLDSNLSSANVLGAETDLQEQQNTNEYNEKYNIKKIAAPVFYDISLVDDTANPSEIVLMGDLIIVSDTAAGNIYTADINTPKFVKYSESFSNINNTQNLGGKLVFTDSTGFKELDPNTNNITTSYSLENPNIVKAYLDFIYELKDGKIIKYTIEDDNTLTDSLWTQNQILDESRDMAIDISIYVLTENGNSISKFTTGTQTQFDIQNLDKPLSQAVQIIADAELDNIYIADTGNNRILVINSDGELIKQIKNENDAYWGDIRSITVSSDEQTLYLLNDTKVYEVSLL